MKKYIYRYDTIHTTLEVFFLHTSRPTQHISSAKMAGKSVFIVGPGFIGWNVLDLLVSEGYSVTGLVRREEHAAGIRKSGGTAILGDLEDKKLIADETEKVEVSIGKRSGI